MLVRDYMTKNPVTIEPGDSLAQANIKLKAGGFRRLPVVKDGKLVGILSQYDLRFHLDSLNSIPVGQVMTRFPVTVSPSETLEHAAALLQRYEIGAMPVVDYHGVVGIISAKDMWMAEPRPLEEWKPLNQTR